MGKAKRLEKQRFQQTIKLGVTNATVNNWENGKTEPTLSQLRKMSDLSGIPMDFIFASHRRVN